MTNISFFIYELSELTPPSKTHAAFTSEYAIINYKVTHNNAMTNVSVLKYKTIHDQEIYFRKKKGKTIA